jgi:dienelactone hydrolase
MGIDPIWRADRSEPLGLWSGPGAPPPGLDVRARRLEYTSRGDRVPARLLLPADGAGPFPLVLLQHGLYGSKESPYLDTTAGPWVRGGAAVASIDFPLHGERADAKLSGAMAGLPGAPASEASRVVAVESIRQAVVDLQRALDALSELPEVDGTRIAYAGFSLGSIVGATFCAVDPRPRAAALALGGAGVGPWACDPARTVADFAPRPLLLVGATRDATIPRSATEALFEAAGEPKQILWFDGTHTELPGAALKAMWEFLREHLGLMSAAR